jgi:hypothetical protein
VYSSQKFNKFPSGLLQRLSVEKKAAFAYNKSLNHDLSVTYQCKLKLLDGSLFAQTRANQT